MGKVRNMAFFDHVSRISLIQIFLEFPGVGHLYIIIPLGFLYKTSLCRSCARVRQKSYNRSKITHALEIKTILLFSYFILLAGLRYVEICFFRHQSTISSRSYLYKILKNPKITLLDNHANSFCI